MQLVTREDIIRGEGVANTWVHMILYDVSKVFEQQKSKVCVYLSIVLKEYHRQEWTEKTRKLHIPRAMIDLWLD